MNNLEQNNTGERPPVYRRRRHFIDASIQGRLLVALIGLEVILFAGAMIWLYLDLSAIIEGNLYRVHYADTDGQSPFLATLFTVIPAILIVNLLAVWIADVIWRTYVRRIVNQLRGMLGRISNLDLRAQPGDEHIQHEVIDKARAWLANERQEFKTVKDSLSGLPNTFDGSDEQALTRAKVVLRELKTLL